MDSPRARIGVAAALFIGWILYLFYLVAITRDPIILSRPQILVADVCVIAKLQEDDGRPVAKVFVTRVLGSAEDAKALDGQSLTLDDLAFLKQSNGWAGAGEYLLPLTRRHTGKETDYVLTAIPPMPGFRPTTVAVEMIAAGPKRNEVIDFLKRELSLSQVKAEEATMAPATLTRFAPPEVASRWHDSLTKLGARVQQLGHETRIYPATDDALRQCQELKP